MDRLSEERIRAALDTHTFGQRLVVLPRTPSTNDVAKDLVDQGAPEGTVVVTDEQTAGRGRLGRRWLAPPGTCLLASILFRPHQPLPQVPRLTMLCSLAAADAVKRLSGLEVALKWPNDLVVEPLISDSSMESPGLRKLAGLLTETGTLGERVAFAVVGIGINVNLPAKALPELAPNATSILAETGRRVDRALLLAALLEGVESRYASLQAGESPHVEWATRLATLGCRVQATTSEGTLAGIAEGVDEDGALLLRTSDGTLHRLTAGDVTLSRP